MAGEIQSDYAHGATLYFLIRNRINQIWNGSVFENYSSVDYSTYDIPMTEDGTASGHYYGSFPTAIIPGVYSISAKKQVAGSPAETDPTIAMGDYQWNGSATLPLSDLATSGQLALAAPIKMARAQMIRNFKFKLVSSTDHITPFVSGVVSGQISRDDGLFGPLQSGNVIETGYGWYRVNLTSGDLNCNTAALVFTANGISGGSSDQRDFSLVLQRSSGN